MPKEQKKKLKESWTSPTFLHSRCKLDPSMFLPSNYAFTLAINIIIFLVLYKLHSVNGPLGTFMSQGVKHKINSKIGWQRGKTRHAQAVGGGL